MPNLGTLAPSLDCQNILKIPHFHLCLCDDVIQQEVEGTQWGKPGPGGTYWRNSAITGQGFYDKMVFQTLNEKINQVLVDDFFIGLGNLR